MGAAPVVTSCSDSEEADEWNATYVYLQREDYLISTVKNFNLTHDRTGIGGDEVEMVFSAKVQKPAAKDIVVVLEAESTCEGLATSDIILTANEVTIKAGQTESESVSAKIDRNRFGSSEDKAEFSFRVSIKDMQTKNGNTLVSSNLHTLAAKINKAAFCNLKTGTPSNSTLLSDNLSWKFTFKDGVENQNSNAVIGNSGNDVATNGDPFWFTVDFKEEKNVVGIYTQHWGAAYAPSQIELFYSGDGSNWKSLGTLDVSGNRQYVTIMSPIKTRYLKYEMLKVPGRVDITRFSVYVANE